MSWWRKVHPTTASYGLQVARPATLGALSITAFKPQGGWTWVYGIGKLWCNGLTQHGPWAHPILYDWLTGEMHLEQRPLRCRSLFPTWLKLGVRCWQEQMPGGDVRQENTSENLLGLCSAGKKAGEDVEERPEPRYLSAQVSLYWTKLGLRRCSRQPNPQIKSGWTNIPNTPKSINKS